MDKCIYFKNQAEKLTYSSAEHIFPAAIGGIKKLDKGIVSDQANNIFSKLERKAFHESMIRINRQFGGIGKRGKRSDKANIQSATIELMQCQDDKAYSLGYLLKGSPITIPQFHIDVESKAITGASIPPSSQGIDLLDFVKTNWTGYYNIIINDKMQSKALLGFHENKWYLAMPNKESQGRCDDIINTLIQAQSIEKTNQETHTSQVAFDIPVVVDENYYRVIAKIAFNYLACICGQEFVLRDEFDSIRNYILNGGDNYKFVAFGNFSYKDMFPFS